MSSQSEYVGQPSWKPSMFWALNREARDKIREARKMFLAKRASARKDVERRLRRAKDAEARRREGR